MTAEQAKIELTLALAEAAEAKAADMDSAAVASSRRSSEASGGGGRRPSTAAGAGKPRSRLARASSAADSEPGSDGAEDGGSAEGGSGSTAEREEPQGLNQQQQQRGVDAKQLEELQLAAAVQTRRAAAAEKEAEALRGQLAEAQRQVGELEWQIQMALEPATIGGKGGQLKGTGGASSGWLADMMGCGANFVRK